jgi:hypothetical protein
MQVPGMDPPAEATYPLEPKDFSSTRPLEHALIWVSLEQRFRNWWAATFFEIIKTEF